MLYDFQIKNVACVLKGSKRTFQCSDSIMLWWRGNESCHIICWTASCRNHTYQLIIAFLVVYTHWLSTVWYMATPALATLHLSIKTYIHIITQVTLLWEKDRLMTISTAWCKRSGLTLSTAFNDDCQKRLSMKECLRTCQQWLMTTISAVVLVTPAV